MPSAPRAQFKVQSTDTRGDGRSEFGIGAGLLAFGATFYGMWLTDATEHGERAFLLLPVLGLVPLGLGFLIGGAAVWARVPGWRALRWAPVAGAIASVLSCGAFFP